MQAWKMTTIAECSTILGDGLHGTPKYDENGEYAFINGNNLHDGKIVIKPDTKRVGFREYEKYKKELTDRTVLVSINGTLGNVAVYNGEKVILGKSACYFNVSTDCDVQFMRYVVSSPRFQQYINSVATGTTIKNVSLKQMREYSFLIPELEEQQRIAKVLHLLDQKIENNQKINDNLLQQAQALYGKFFPYDVADELPAGWRIGTVGEIVEIHDSKRIPLSGAQRAKMEKRIYPYYGAASLMDYVDEYIFDGIYLLLGEDGTVVDDAGYPILQYVWGQFWVNNHAHILTGKLGFNVESLLLLLKRTPVKSIVTGAVQPKISQANLRSVQVVIPPQPELDVFNELIRPMFDQIRQNQDQNKALAAMRDALLPKLMSGEVDVSAIQI